MRRSPVSSRVALLLRSAEGKLCLARFFPASGMGLEPGRDGEEYLGDLGFVSPAQPLVLDPWNFFSFLFPFVPVFHPLPYFFFFIFSPFPRKFFFKNLEKFFSRVGFCGATLYKSYHLGRRVEILPWVVGIRVGFWGLPGRISQVLDPPPPRWGGSARAPRGRDL